MRASRLILPLLATLCAGPALSQSKAPAGSTSAVDGERMRHAEDLLEHGDYKAAETELKALALSAPGDARVQYDLGFTEEHNGEDKAAATAYAAAIAADSALPEPEVALGLLEARGGQLEAARTQLAAAVKLPAAPPALRGRALRALARLDETARPEDARAELLQAAQLTGEQDGDAALSANLAARAGDPADAEAVYRRELVATPADPVATVGLAALLLHAGRAPEADTLLAPALAAHPDDPQLAAEAAAVDAAEGRNTEAITLLQHLRAAQDGADGGTAANPALTRMLAHLELVSGDVAGAEPLYRGLVAATPNDPVLLDDFGSTLVRGNKFAEAETVLSHSVAQRAAFHDDPAWGEAEGHLAFAASRNHHPEVALQALRERATVLSNSPASLFLEATSYDALHRYKQAGSSYRAFLAVAGGKLPDEEFEARHRLVALEHEH